MAKIQTPGGYEYDEANLEGRGDVVIKLPYAEAYNIILDALQSEASIEPLNSATFAGNTEAILGLLIDASSESHDEDNFDDEYQGK
jgi:hypothetical protein